MNVQAPQNTLTLVGKPSMVLAASKQALQHPPHSPQVACDTRDAAIAAVSAELSASMAMALSGLLHFLPDHYRDKPGGKTIERTQHYVDALMVTVEHMTVGVTLRNLLQYSDCPYARELRAALIAGYAQMNAEDIARARGLI